MSENVFVRKYAATILKNSYLATPNTFLIALQSHEINPISSQSVLPHVDFMPVNEVGLERLVENNPSMDQHNFWILRIINKVETELLLAYKELLKPYLGGIYFQNLQKIKDLDNEALWMEFGQIMNDLEKKYDQSIYHLGKRIVKELILRGEIPQWEIENGIRTNLDENNYLNYAGIFNLYMAGELRTESVIPELVQILDKDEGDLALEEARDALIKIGTEIVIDEVAKIALNEPAFYFTIEVLAKIKTKKAEQLLLHLFDNATDPTAKTMIADALCQHLSIEAIPKVQKLIEDGYDSMLLDLDKSLYANIVINEVDQPHRLELEKSLEEEARLQEERNSMLDPFTMPVKTEKVGRNDPCPCGSGKKYKKCCMN
ncbi:SEC-C metal-binding domain-containing protein [Niallia sp. Krafla_26]|uniref:SEC-C metal-binding domain-containing protein n=1 Tax=Niallia sp. Krafla_26 TaxID=3064703 RepID=UPI003D16C136